MVLQPWATSLALVVIPVVMLVAIQVIKQVIKWVIELVIISVEHFIRFVMNPIEVVKIKL